MVEPVIVPRAEHAISRRNIDPDALKVLYRLHDAGFVAYLVGGSVRDLLLGRRPKDFDVGTTAHPYQIKKLFRNSWIIGRRFRLAHVRFGQKVIEVATFRRHVPAGTEEEPPLPQIDGPDREGHPVPAEPPGARTGHVHRDNTFGTPEEDAFRRDFTINALFYDIGTFSVIDYVEGLADLRRGLIRSIGNPDDRFVEDPVRMLRAIVFSARLGFAIDPAVSDAIARNAAEIRHSAPARLLEEYFKILRSGHATQAFSALSDARLVEHISPELGTPLGPELEMSLARLDRYRQMFDSAPDTLSTTILLGSLVVPLGLLRRRPHAGADSHAHRLPQLGHLPVARRDVERLDQLLGLQRRLTDLGAPPRAQRSLLHRHVFPDALTWLEIHGNAPEAVSHWKALAADDRPHPRPEERREEGAGGSRRRRRRRRRRPPTTG